MKESRETYLFNPYRIPTAAQILNYNMTHDLPLSGLNPNSPSASELYVECFGRDPWDTDSAESEVPEYDSSVIIISDYD